MLLFKYREVEYLIEKKKIFNFWGVIYDTESFEYNYGR